MASKILDACSTSSIKFNWRIENFSKLNAHEGHRSDVFSVGPFKWTVKIYSKGIGEVYDHLSLGLIPFEWTKSVQAEFSFAVTSQTDPSNTKRHELDHNFTTPAGAGFPHIMPLSEFHDHAKGYLVNDTCFIRVEVTCKVLEKDDTNGAGGVNLSNTDTVPEIKLSNIKEERQ